MKKEKNDSPVSPSDILPELPEMNSDKLPDFDFPELQKADETALPKFETSELSITPEAPDSSDRSDPEELSEIDPSQLPEMNTAKFPVVISSPRRSLDEQPVPSVENEDTALTDVDTSALPGKEFEQIADAPIPKEDFDRQDDLADNRANDFTQERKEDGNDQKEVLPPEELHDDVKKYSPSESHEEDNEEDTDHSNRKKGKNKKAKKGKDVLNAEKEIDRAAVTRISEPVTPGSLQKTEEEPEGKEKKKKKDTVPPKIVKRHPNSSIYAFTGTILYLIFVISAAVLLSIFALDVAIDAFGFSSDGVPVDITVTGEYITIDDLAQQLYDQHVIRHPTIFSLYARLRHKSDVQFVAGTAKDVSPQAGYDQLIDLFSPKPAPRKEITVSVPEGYTVDNIIDLFVNTYHLGTREAFEYVINEYPFSTDDYWFLESVQMTPGRIYRLEGYLYPDTYRFYDYYNDKEGDIPGTAAAKAVVVKMLNEFGKNFKKSYFRKSQEYLAKYYPNAPEMTLDQIITLASIIEREALPAERVTVSAVFYNRLCNPTVENIGGRLQSDVTSIYYLRHMHLPETSSNIVSCNTPYNTRKNPGLPPGPIVSPSFESLNAALYPQADCPYYFFVATASGYSFFAQTLEEHLVNITRVENGEEAHPFENEDWEDVDEQ